MFLEPEQIETLTGYKRVQNQEQALNEMGITHKVNAAGKIIVLESHVNKLLDGNDMKINNNSIPQPNLGALDG